MTPSYDTNEAMAGDDVHAIGWIQKHMWLHAMMSPMGCRWLTRAMNHIENRLERALRDDTSERVTEHHLGARKA